MFYYIKVLLKAKYNFLPPKKTEVLIYDYHSKDIVDKIFDLKKISFLSIRKEKINIFILIKSFLNLKFSYFNYLICFIKYVKPKLLVTSIDNNRNFYKIKNYDPNLITIFFQNGHRSAGEGDILGFAG